MFPNSIALSIDVEDWFHPQLVRDKTQPGECIERLSTSLSWLLDELRARKITATCFWVGELIAAHPGLVQRVVSEGHEFACHGFTHTPLWELNPDTFRHELERFFEALHTVTGLSRVAGFRAPTFSLDPTTLWAVPILEQFGFNYDSSIFPIRNHLYGMAGAPTSPYRLAPSLLEIPATVFDRMGIRLPFAGGFYFRALPLFLQRQLYTATLRRGPAGVYFHPWELDPKTPQLKLRALDRFITYYNLKSNRARFLRFLESFSFGRYDQVYRVTP